jgi:hypothetical protein
MYLEMLGDERCALKVPSLDNSLDLQSQTAQIPQLVGRFRPQNCTFIGGGSSRMISRMF